jgi:hypothetical protein
MTAPPDPEMRRGAVGRGTPKIAKSRKQKQRYQVLLDLQAAAFVLLPIIVSVVLLALASRQGGAA